ncbi:uncharacterized protein LOC127230894 [Phodopus roborovskii]|uniref:uncharacterized protein LOC127230894 n=1 Tax=Phodopus roborovskii TaxID=109678 RepID=UPI0021E46BF1|nr:uncharacterized protein LOC127230894 [Phodopus roborovskii]
MTHCRPLLNLTRTAQNCGDTAEGGRQSLVCGPDPRPSAARSPPPGSQLTQLPQKIAVAAASSRFNPRPTVIGQLLRGKKSTPWQPDKPIKSPADMTAATPASKNGLGGRAEWPLHPLHGLAVDSSCWPPSQTTCVHRGEMSVVSTAQWTRNEKEASGADDPTVSNINHTTPRAVPGMCSPRSESRIGLEPSAHAGRVKDRGHAIEAAALRVTWQRK